MKFLEKLENNSFTMWTSIIISTIIIVFFYFFMEWLFLITKPSFMTTQSFTDQFGLLIQTVSLLFTIFIFFTSLLLFLVNKLHKIIKWLAIVALLFPSLVLTCLILLLIDNFTYTVFHFGIVTSKGIFRAFYGLIFLVLLFRSFKLLISFSSTIQILIEKYEKKGLISLFSIIGISLLIIGLTPFINLTSSNYLPFLPSKLKSTPNVILITVDGVNADNMSVYGYERETTPFLDHISNELMIAQNAFTNSANTSGSIISILTGKHPLDTRVLYPPDILLEEDAYEHLPAILKSNGYATSQYSFGHYVDAYQFNLLNGFDEANGRTSKNNILGRINQYLPDNISFFLYEIGNRIFDRIRHIFFIKQMSNPKLEVSSPEKFNDMDKLDSFFNFLENSNKPVFSHIHWMGTHGARFTPSNQVFSSGQEIELQNDWELDFYDDSILDFDQAVRILYSELNHRGILDNSIIIIASDHGQRFTTDKRLPLIIRFPNADNQGTIRANVQNLDITPTILDYLGISVPIWMSEGVSLIRELPEDRLIFSVGVGNVEVEGGNIVSQTKKPPFYQFGHISAINCETRFLLDLGSLSWQESKVEGYIGNCYDQKLTKNKVIDEIIKFLDSYGYDTSSLNELFD